MKSDREENNQRVRLGFVGCGRVVETRHLPALRNLPGAEVVALSDVDAARLENVAGRFGVARRYVDYKELLACEEVDAVAVCTPPQFHAGAGVAALEAGKHLFVEKPLALSLEECDRLIEAAQGRDVLKATVGFNLRRHRLVREARDLIAGGELGAVKLVRTVIASGVRRQAEYPEWLRSRETGGGALFELGVHHFDLVRFLLGSEPEEVFAAYGEGDETATVMARMSCGAQLVSAFCENTGQSHEVEVYGERGWLRVSCYRFDGLDVFSATDYAGSIGLRLRRLGQTIRELPRGLRLARKGGDYLATYREEWQHFVEAIRAGCEPESTLEDGRRALEMVLAAVRSSASGRAVRIGETDEEADRPEREARVASRV